MKILYCAHRKQRSANTPLIRMQVRWSCFEHLLQFIIRRVTSLMLSELKSYRSEPGYYSRPVFGEVFRIPVCTSGL